MRNTNDTLLRYLQLLQLLPVAPKQKSTTKLRAELASLDDAYAVSARTIQRDLEKLSLIFPLSSETEGRSNYWFWSDQSSYTQFPAMGAAQALALVLSDKYLENILPPSLDGLLEAYVDKAQKVLEKSEFSTLNQKIVKIGSGPKLVQKEVKIETRQLVFDAVLQGMQLKLRYKNAEGRSRTYDKLHPLGIVIKDQMSYLVAFTMPDKSRRQFALHRIEKAFELDEKALGDKQFDLQSYIEKEEEFSYPVSRSVIRLKLKIASSLVAYFKENSLSENQKVEKTDNHWFVTANTGDNADLRWWLMSYGNKVEVVSPLPLREEITQLLVNSAGQYLNNGSFANMEESMSYLGELNVEDGWFELDASRFICRNTEVAFLLSGVDEYGPFSIEGKSALTKDGYYISSLLPVVYQHHSDGGEATIRFSDVQTGKGVCSVKGAWTQAGDTYVFEGVLQELSKLRSQNQ